MFSFIGLYPMLMISPFQGFAFVLCFYHWVAHNAFECALSGLCKTELFSFIGLYPMLMISPFQGFAFVLCFYHSAAHYSFDCAALWLFGNFLF
ncbi:hypothetical protein [Chryseobacterium sp.]|uniref:hypothetical protein n=1 Tax=Chryseobacterium sp. TaxID=1871047 RepID=UPI002FC6C5AA